MIAACPLCGSTDENHHPAPVERKALRRLKWRAFWHGLCGLPGPSLDEIRRELRCAEENA